MPHNKKKNKKRSRLMRVEESIHSFLKEKKKQLQKVGKSVGSMDDVVELGLKGDLELSEEEKRKLGIK